jgi:hypothetical protein
MDRFKQFGYLEPLRELEQTLQSDIWISGGWVRSANLQNMSYCGDIDLLVARPPDELIYLMLARGVSVCSNLSGGIRIPLMDGNHCDLSSTYLFGNGSSVEHALNSYNFSVNAVAVSLRTGEVVAVRRAIEDLDARRFTVLAPIEEGIYDRLVTADGFVQFYGLTPNGDQDTLDVCRTVDEQRALHDALIPEEALAAAGLRIAPLVPAAATAWLVRGAVRCAILRDLCFWDDVDVVVDCERDRLLDHLSQNGFNFILNFHGNPKIRLLSGHKVDIWSLGKGGLASELARYEFNVDSIAWNVNERRFEDPCGWLQSTLDRKLMVRNVSDYPGGSLAPYIALKAAYLCMRHALIPMGSEVIKLFAMPIGDGGYIRKHAHRLAREASCAIPRYIERDLYELRVSLSNSSAFEMLFCSQEQ